LEVKNVSEEEIPIEYKGSICDNCKNQYIDCDHCLRSPDYQEAYDCYEPKNEEE